jgi:hypothetical protein
MMKMDDVWAVLITIVFLGLLSFGFNHVAQIQCLHVGGQFQKHVIPFLSECATPIHNSLNGKDHVHDA